MVSRVYHVTVRRETNILFQGGMRRIYLYQCDMKQTCILCSERRIYIIPAHRETNIYCTSAARAKYTVWYQWSERRIYRAGHPHHHSRQRVTASINSVCEYKDLGGVLAGAEDPDEDSVGPAGGRVQARQLEYRGSGITHIFLPNILSLVFLLSGLCGFGSRSNRFCNQKHWITQRRLY